MASENLCTRAVFFAILPHNTLGHDTDIYTKLTPRIRLTQQLPETYPLLRTRQDGSNERVDVAIDLIQYVRLANVGQWSYICIACVYTGI